MSALYFATMLDNVDMVKFLLEDMQADPMIGDYRGYRPIDVGASASPTLMWMCVRTCDLCVLLVVVVYVFCVFVRVE